MYYVLNFNNHQFISFQSEAEVCRKIRQMKEEGIAVETSVEVVNCWSDDVRCSGAEFLQECEDISDTEHERTSE